MANARKRKSGRPTPRRQPPQPDGQPGKRPSNPAFLMLLALAWIACGVYAIAALSASWRFVPGIFFIGVGVLFLRGAAQTVVRRTER